MKIIEINLEGEITWPASVSTKPVTLGTSLHNNAQATLLTNPVNACASLSSAALAQQPSYLLTACEALRTACVIISEFCCNTKLDFAFFNMCINIRSIG